MGTLLRTQHRGSTEDRSRWVLEHQDAVFNTAYRILGDGELAGQVTRETFLRAFPEPAESRDATSRRLLRIAIRLCCARLRRGRLGPQALAIDGDPCQRCLQALPLEQRIVVLLADGQGMSDGEIAGITGVPARVVRSRLSEGRARLRDALVSRGLVDPSYAQELEGARRAVGLGLNLGEHQAPGPHAAGRPAEDLAGVHTTAGIGRSRRPAGP